MLRRVVSRRMLFFFILGDILGGGIYALVGVVGAEVGGAIWVSFLVALLLAALTAGSYAELVTKHPRAGGAALYDRDRRWVDPHGRSRSARRYDGASPPGRLHSR